MKTILFFLIGFFLTITVFSIYKIHADVSGLKAAKIEAFCEGWKAGQSTINRYTDVDFVFKIDSIIYSTKIKQYEN